MKHIFTILLALFFAVPLFSQEREKSNEGFKRGYKGILEVESSITAGHQTPYLLRVGLHIINAFQLNPYFSLGIGTGAYRSISKGLLIPVFGDIRVNFISVKANPYLSLGLGYSFLLSSSIEEAMPAPGLYLNPAAGIEKRFSDKFAMHLGLGFFLDRIENNSSAGDGWALPDNGLYYLPGISLNLGISF